MTLIPPDPDSSDEALMRQVAAGDIGAFTELFRRRQASVYRFALHMTGSPETAEDVTQDVFLAVMRDGRRYEWQRGTVASWLCGITRNLVRQRLARDQKLHPLADDNEGEDSRLPAVQPDPVDDMTRAQRVEALRRAILRLPLRYREVVVLCDLQEMPYADAAAVLGCALGTVRSRLHRGRALLAGRLAAVGSERGTLPEAPRHRRCFA
jgi:RNA polymerase sigma-70 factor (ECF subfamily)